MSDAILVRSGARRDMDRLADFIGDRNRTAGRRFLEAARETIHKIASTPELGTAYESANPLMAGVRVWPVQGFDKVLVFYQVRSAGIVVVRVLHGARDIENILGLEG